MITMSSFKNLKHMFLRLLVVLFLIFISITLISGSSMAADGDNGSSDLGWWLFYIVLIVLIVIVILWVLTYFYLNKIIKRLRGERDKIKRYESRKDADREHDHQEKARDRKRRARAPKGNCLVCNRKFIPGADAYQCECGKFMHVHCLAEMELCPNCGRDVDKDTGVVRIEDSGGSDTPGAGRSKINRLIKAKLCPVCNKIIKAGESAMECDRCQTIMHIKCSDKTRKCPKCGA
jgi:hypothetical protein